MAGDKRIRVPKYIYGAVLVFSHLCSFTEKSVYLMWNAHCEQPLVSQNYHETLSILETVRDWK